MGGALAASWRDATHLIMSAPLRTVKLLCCLSRCKFIVSLQWLLECSAKNTFVDENAYMLGDPEFEKNFNCNIEKTLASPNRGTVLKVTNYTALYRDQFLIVYTNDILNTGGNTILFLMFSDFSTNRVKYFMLHRV